MNLRDYAGPLAMMFLPLTLFHSNSRLPRKLRPPTAMGSMKAVVMASLYASSAEPNKSAGTTDRKPCAPCRQR